MILLSPLSSLSSLSSCSLLLSFFLLFTCTAWFLFPGCSGQSRPGTTGPFQSRPNLILISIDTLRADHLGCYGYSNIDTPYIDRLAKEGVLFTQAFTPVPITLPSHVSIFTGLYPPTHGVRNNGTFRLGASAITLAEILKQNGYQTGAIVASYTLDSRFGLDQGFTYYDDHFPQIQTGPSLLHNEQRGEEVSTKAIMWLEQNQGSKFFLWLHYFDPHADYAPPEPFCTKYKNQEYNGEIAYTDMCLGKVLDKMQQLNLLDNTLIVLTSDHGEGLGEHQERTHGFFIYDSTLRVPLIFRYPDKLPKPKKLNKLVRTIDIMPTILDLLAIPDLPVELKMQGINLIPLINEDGQTRELDLYCETMYPELSHSVSSLFGVRTPEWKYIQAPRSELYSLLKDPSELNNLLTSSTSSTSASPTSMPSSIPSPNILTPEAELKTRLANMQKDLLASAKSFASTSSLFQVKKMDKEERDKLQSLGYVWTARHSDQEANLPDPKDRIALMDEVDTGLSLYAKGRLAEADEVFQRVLQTNPGDVVTLFMLGLVYQKQGKRELSIQRFQQTIELDPNYGDAHKQLGVLYASIGKFDEAESEFKKAAQLTPNDQEILNFLGGLYIWKQQPDEAEKNIRLALSADPNFPDAHYNLGLLYSRKNLLNQAIDEFKTALRLKPGYKTIHKELGDLYLMTNQLDLAIQELKKAVELQPDEAGLRIHLGIAYYSHQESEASLLELQKALTLEPDNPEAYFHQGVVYGQQNKLDLASTSYQRAIKIKPDYAAAYLNLGTIHFQRQDIDQAIAMYRQAVIVAPNYAQAHFNLATAYETKGMIDEAIPEYEATLRLEPNFTQAKLLLERALQSQIIK